MLDLRGNPFLSCCLLLVQGRVEVFLNSTISPPILSYVFGVFNLCDKVRFRDIKICWSNSTPKMERKIGEGSVLRIGPLSEEKKKGPCWIQQQY